MEVKVMNTTEKKELMGKYAKKLENAIKREATVMKEIENDKALITKKVMYHMIKKILK